MVEIDHGYGLVTRYAHTSAVLVKQGQIVERGAQIAKVGESGLAFGPHLHYEVLQNGRPTDPRKFLLDLSVVPD
jgi:murein DD-endopeptidase MepM/ murein hydrolase activator NlpD